MSREFIIMDWISQMPIVKCVSFGLIEIKTKFFSTRNRVSFHTDFHY